MTQPKFPFTTECLLSLATGPLLLGVLATKALAECLDAAGAASEEVFRGDRLPVLHFPHKGQQSNDSP
ncbi:hypothetical protein H6F77_25110 [Microcoleus sp. FACHB-831]|uniref:hypothetical protein n=1 Tax=Microcoleus sp. FACHB-831 TaxID=2692827 RepID=UPI0016856FDC|nr:hypothetical protein [Microcoleus sp. FACHB-831]MBD1924325.1 hypothetical protein [Microcoleus sp. FACHB-831]